MFYSFWLATLLFPISRSKQVCNYKLVVVLVVFIFGHLILVVNSVMQHDGLCNDCNTDKLSDKDEGLLCTFSCLVSSLILV